MHLLLAQKGEIAQAGEAVDLGQSAADVIFLSAADTELFALATAYALLRAGNTGDEGLKQGAGLSPASLRLANLMQLAHPVTVDTYLARTATHAKLIIVRLLGGKSYWPYGVTSLHALSVQKNIRLALLPGDERVDPELMQFSTLAASEYQELWAYLCQGGSVNSLNFLRYCGFLLGQEIAPPSPAPLLKAGLWWPGHFAPDLETVLNQTPVGDRTVVAIVFYRALVSSGQTEAVSALLRACQARGLVPLPIFITSLKDELSNAILADIFARCPPDIVLNATGFAARVGTDAPSVLEQHGNMVLQVTFSSTPYRQWRESSHGLCARDLAMNISLPEMDGRIFSRAVAFKSALTYDEVTQCNLIRQQPVASRVDFVADLTANWLKLRNKKPDQRRIALIMANYPGSDGRLGHGVGLDTPAAGVHILHKLREAGYDTGVELPSDGDMLMQRLLDGPSGTTVAGRSVRVRLSLAAYQRYFMALPAEIQTQMLESWGTPECDACFVAGGFALPILHFGKFIVALQPDRAQGMVAKDVYHAPDIVPCHHYMAFYFYLRHEFGADAVVHIGKHGNLEWLPGKALALSETCYPELALGACPHVYPFIVNDPGEGTQAKRRSAAVIIDHMIPPLTRAGTYGTLRDLETLVDEYYQASGLDPRRLVRLKRQILDLVQLTGINRDAGIAEHDGDDLALQKLDAFLCDLKELQIRDGLHVFGQAPQGARLDSLLVALTRLPRGKGSEDSLHRAIADDLQLKFDPLNCDMADLWQEAKPELLQNMDDDAWRTQGDTVERIELLALALVSGKISCPSEMRATKAVLGGIEQILRPQLKACGHDEMGGLLKALDGRFVAPGPAGAPTRGRLDVLPTGRNFFSLDNRSLPTVAAWDLGARSAELLIVRYVQEHGCWPLAFALTAWGTANMRTGGDDIAQALALIGAKPVWEMGSSRVTGYEIVPLAKLNRPRIDVTLRISGFFRDAFPEQIILFDQAIRAIGALQGEGEKNPVALAMQQEKEQLLQAGRCNEQADREAGYRIFGAKPGAYGTGVQDFLQRDERVAIEDLGRIFMEHSAHAYGAKDSEAALPAFKKRLGAIEAIVQNQDNREHDLLDSGEYYAFEGGMAAAVATQKGEMPVIFHNDLSRPERPQVKTLEEEIGRTLRGRAVNPQWIAGVMRHGYKGAAEMAATVDYLFAFAVTTRAVQGVHFDAIYEAYLGDEKVYAFLKAKNPAALQEIATRLIEADRRKLWQTRSNSARLQLNRIVQDIKEKGDE